ncbi:hypothetical protein HCU74_11255 [Spongiibacter sp. KMU-166]|uniref:TnsA endonuclease N-terminal domain-containing protein n=1 Tax=Spongiibacter thalassae TaxID=2721624 RepID=A0ABX1GGA4_9GAMM|nr:hypothetical protein [Spongiibacter thalassae]NKI17981.1 hypothetical protein [Spongiibacter thalassae]
MPTPSDFRAIDTPAHHRSVVAESLVPCQVPTPKKLRVATDCYEQHFVKFPFVATLHSYSEYLYAGLLEGDPKVGSFVPQPFRLRVGRRKYIPDFYVVSGQHRIVIELKARGEFDRALRVPLEAFFDFYGMKFSIISNDTALTREREALTWLDITRRLASAGDIDTGALEYKLYDQIQMGGNIEFGDIIDEGDRAGSYTKEIALLRLLHRGKLQADLTTPLQYDTVLRSCT